MNVLELHVLQSVPVNNINRGEDGDNKTVMIGGCERQRVSSQAWKRPIRTMIQDESVRNGDPSGIISRVFGDRIIAELVAEGNSEKDVKKFLDGIKVGYSKDSTEKKNAENKDTLMYLSTDEVDAIKNAFAQEDKKTLTSILKEANCRIASDIALFGRMFASDQQLSVYAAVKMNHAFSTHAIDVEDDYFSAVDQLNPDGAGHLGNQAYTTSTMYRYLALDIDQLRVNLGDGADVNAVIRSFVKAAYTAFPKGKENVMASYSRPFYVRAVVKNGQPEQFSDAFETPVPATVDGYNKTSEERLDAIADDRLNRGWDEILFDGKIERMSDVENIINALGTN